MGLGQRGWGVHAPKNTKLPPPQTAQPMLHYGLMSMVIKRVNTFQPPPSSQFHGYVPETLQIHLMNEAIVDVLLILLSRVLKPDVVAECSMKPEATFADQIKNVENRFDDGAIFVSFNMREKISTTVGCLNDESEIK